MVPCTVLAHAPHAPEESEASPPSSWMRSRMPCAARPWSSCTSRSRPTLPALSVADSLSTAIRYVSAAEISPRNSELSWRTVPAVSSCAVRLLPVLEHVVSKIGSPLLPYTPCRKTLTQAAYRGTACLVSPLGDSL